MIPRSVGTHDGSFHADEVSACALLLVFDLIDEDKIFRTRDPAVLEKCSFVCDVGGIYDPATQRFDHHQLEYTGDYSSAGMIWRYLYEKEVVDKALYDYLNQMIISGVDAHDNGKVVQKEGVCTFSHIIANFVPVAYEAKEEELNEAFFKALEFAKAHIQRLIDRYSYILSCKGVVELAMEEKGHALVFDQPLPWQENFFALGGENHPALFVVMPAGEHWKLRGIPPNEHQKMQVRRSLPKAWLGLRDDELKQASGIQGAIFCHKGGFISVWETKEDALNALSAVLQDQGV